MKKILISITESLDRALALASERQGGNKSESVEAWLWRIKDVREAAADLREPIKPERTPRGRPSIG